MRVLLEGLRFSPLLADLSGAGQRRGAASGPGQPASASAAWASPPLVWRRDSLLPTAGRGPPGASEGSALLSRRAGGRGLGAGKLCKVAAAGSCCRDYRARSRMGARPSHLTPNLRRVVEGRRFHNSQRSLACFGTVRAQTQAPGPLDAWTSQREMSRVLPLTLGHILPGQALGPGSQGLRVGRGRPSVGGSISLLFRVF